MILYDFYSRGHMCVSALSTPIKHVGIFLTLTVHLKISEKRLQPLKISLGMIFYRRIFLSFVGARTRNFRMRAPAGTRNPILGEFARTRSVT